MGDSYTETLSYTSDVNKLFPTNNEYPIYGQQYYAYKEDFISERDYKCIIFCLCGDERIVEILKIY